MEELFIKEIVNFQSVLLDNINLNNNKDSNNESKINKNESPQNINRKLINEDHEHKLVLLFSNNDWTCKKCNGKFQDKIPKYFCSLCDYNICENCFNNKKMYPLKEYYHEQTKLKIYKFPFHDHKLIYCRTSRFDDRISQWLCDLCSKNYNYKIWSFYCTECDYDICLKCAYQQLPKEDLVSNIGVKTDCHEHPLIYSKTNLDWICLVCLQSFEGGIFPSYCCTFCEFFLSRMY